jgi:pyruvate,orthophosphate dikinase
LTARNRLPRQEGYGTANDHREADYDRVVLQRLSDLHLRADPLIRRAGAVSPRLAGYGVRLARAAACVAAGDHGCVARIISDSYHTVWFELHEDLISLAGLTPEAEARPYWAARLDSRKG